MAVLLRRTTGSNGDGTEQPVPDADGLEALGLVPGEDRSGDPAPTRGTTFRLPLLAKPLSFRSSGPAHPPATGGVPDPAATPLAADEAPPGAEPHRRGYMPALDGLRAMAVLAVIAYHAGLPGVPGGLLGVDVFFVLSGYLITGLLLKEHRRNGRIDLKRFWLRRARRLLPALLLLLTAVAVYAATLADPSDVRSLRGDGLSALLYVANWHFAFSHQGYFDHFSTPSPLLHLWSLGVEEQFYLLWPLVVVLLLRRGRARRVTVVAAIGALVSAVVTVGLAAVGADLSRLYYGSDTRAQALLVGAALAAALTGRRLQVSTRARRAVQLIGYLGAAGIAFSWFHVNGETPALYRGGFLAVAVAVAGVLLSVTQVPTGPLARVLSVAPLRAVGRISYGLYLWHWPTFLILTHARSGLPGPLLLLARLAATFALAGLSYRLVEQPIRTRRLRLPRPRLVVPTVVGLVGAIVVVCTMAAGTPKADTEIQALDELAADAQSQQPVVAPATVPATQRPKRVLLVGDSVALTLGGGLAPLQSTYGVQVYNHGWVGCGIARRSMAYDGARYYPAWSDCAQWPTRWAQWRDQSQPDVAALLIGRWEVVDRNFHGRWTHIGDPQFDAYLAGELDNAVAVLSAKGARVMLMTAPVYHARELPDGSSSPVNNPDRVARLNQLIREAVDRHPGVAQLYDLESVLTPGGVYQQTLSGVNVRFDDGVHISKQGAALIAQTLMPCLAERSRCSNNLTAASVPSGGG